MFEQTRVRDVMTETVYTVFPHTPLIAAQKVMKDKKIRRLPVVMGGAEVVGIVTLGDVREASPSDATSLSIWELNALWAELTVERIMTKPVIVVHPDDLIVKAAELMLNHKVSGLPVVENNALIGIVTEADIFRMMIRSHRPSETASSQS